MVNRTPRLSYDYFFLEWLGKEAGPTVMPSQIWLSCAFIHPDLGLGGAERLVVDAALELSARGHAVSALTLTNDRQEHANVWALLESAQSDRLGA